MNFISIRQLNQDIVEHLYLIPEDVDLVVGVPRSGMLVATLIALYLNKSLTDLDTFLEGKLYPSGITKSASGVLRSFGDVRKALVVEDSSNSGASVKEAKAKLQKMKQPVPVVFLTAYVNSETKALSDIWFREVPQPRCFEWNFMHYTRFMREACVDIDGVLCIDPTEEENDDGEKYRHFLRNARPKYIPSAEIGHLVTSRLEKYRKDTEYWLAKHGIRYKELHMMNLPTAEERRRLGNHARFKASVFKKCRDARWFLESEPKQAEEIRRLTGKEVFCVDEMAVSDATLLHRLYWEKDELFLDRIKKRLPAPVRSGLRKVKNTLSRGKRR